MSARQATAPRIAAVIPTFRRPASLLRALESLRHQTLEDFSVLVVDNAAQAEVAALVQGFAATAPMPVRYVAQPVPGLHSARNLALRVAGADVLAFTDDDATFEPGWLAAHQRAFAADPGLGAAGGPVLPVFEAPPPDWLTRRLAGQREFPVLSLVQPLGADIRGPEAPVYGVNLAVRRELAVALGGFHPECFGAVWLGDGETGLLRKLAGAGHGLAALAGAVVHHHIPPERMTPAYFCRRMANQGAADVYTDFHRAMPGRARLVRHAGGLALRHWRTWARAWIVRGRTGPGELETQMAAAATLARLGYVLRLTWDARLRALVRRDNWMDDGPAGPGGEARP